MANSKIDEIRKLLISNKKVYVNELSEIYQLSEVSIRKYLTKLEQEGFALRFYGGAELAESMPYGNSHAGIYSDDHWIGLARTARSQVQDGDCIFIGSGRTCCVLARELTGLTDLTVVTNNITALPDLIRNASRVYMIGGEVTSTDSQTLFSSWESPQTLLGNIYVNKAFTSISGIDMKAGLTVDSVISTYIYKQIPIMAHRWYLISDSSKFDKIAIYPVAELSQISTLITNGIPDRYQTFLDAKGIPVLISKNE